MPRKVKLDKGVLDEGEYKLIRVTSYFSPSLYRNIRAVMDKKGISTEATYLQMAATSFNSNDANSLEGHIKRVLEDGGTFLFLEDNISYTERIRRLRLTLEAYSNKASLADINLGYKK